MTERPYKSIEKIMNQCLDVLLEEQRRNQANPSDMQDPGAKIKFFEILEFIMILSQTFYCEHGQGKKKDFLQDDISKHKIWESQQLWVDLVDYHIRTDIAKKKIDNEKRDREVPSNVIDRMYRNFEIPHKSEGFDEIIVDLDEKTNLYLSNKSKGGIGFLKDELLAIETYDDYKSLLCQLGLNQCIDMPQDSKWHTLSLSKHMYFCFRAVREYHWYDINLVIASMLHDISKPNVRIEDKDKKYAHYYGHENASAYDVIDILLRYVRIDIEDILEIAWLIGNHMKLKNNIDKDKFSNIIGYDDYLRLEALDNADNSAK